MGLCEEVRWRADFVGPMRDSAVKKIVLSHEELALLFGWDRSDADEAAEMVSQGSGGRTSMSY